MGMLEIRSDLLRAVRAFFYDRGFIEVETPVRIPFPALELNIDAEESGSAYLRTSPELHMKRMLVDGPPKIFQMGPCFRKGERGNLHNPEYTMLEWYRTDADYMDVLDDAKGLIEHVCECIKGREGLEYGGVEIDVSSDWECVLIEEMFGRFAGWNPVSDYDADLFDEDMVHKIEPRLRRDRPVVLMDYPREAAALARIRKEETPVAERWELYIGGIELANAFSELTDATEQRGRFEQCACDRLKSGKDVYGIDEEFMSAMKEGLPRCAGVALGIDRLTMLMTGSSSIEDVRAFL
ncbi:EF-P lysine aminoacylase GenX [bacterium]|nr:EF-P lysine aminoacylase GenX [bacterium]